MEDLGLLSWSSELRSYCPSHPPGHIAFVAKLPKYMLKCVPWMRKYSKIILKLNLFFSYQSKLMSQGVLNIVWSKHPSPMIYIFCHLIFSRLFIKVILTCQMVEGFFFFFNLSKVVCDIFSVLIGLLERNVSEFF